MKRFCDYRSAARNMEGPDFRMLLAKLVFGFSTTLCVTIAGAVLQEGELQDIIHGRVKMDEVPVEILLLCFSILFLPCMLSIIMALQHDYNYAPKILALRYAAALVEQEMFRYRACASYYSDEKILAAKANDAKKAKAAAAAEQEGGNAHLNTQDAQVNAQDASMDTQKEDTALRGNEVQADTDNMDAKNDNSSTEEILLADGYKDHHRLKDAENVDLDFDIPSTRTRRLTEELIKIGEKVPVFDCPDVKDEEAEIEKFTQRFQIGKKKASKKFKGMLVMCKGGSPRPHRADE
jgi:hypothetical protein